MLPIGPEPSVFSSAAKKCKVRIYNTMILPMVLCWCESRSLTLKKQHRLRVFQERLLRRIFGPKRDQVM
jgi:hypothetical protein